MTTPCLKDDSAAVDFGLRFEVAVVGRAQPFETQGKQAAPLLSW